MIYTIYMIYMDNQEEGLAVEKCRNEEKSELRILCNCGIMESAMQTSWKVVKLGKGLAEGSLAVEKWRKCRGNGERGMGNGEREECKV